MAGVVSSGQSRLLARIIRRAQARSRDALSARHRRRHLPGDQTACSTRSAHSVTSGPPSVAPSGRGCSSPCGAACHLPCIGGRCARGAGPTAAARSYHVPAAEQHVRQSGHADRFREHGDGRARHAAARRRHDVGDHLGRCDQPRQRPRRAAFVGVHLRHAGAVPGRRAAARLPSSSSSWGLVVAVISRVPKLRLAVVPHVRRASSTSVRLAKSPRNTLLTAVSAVGVSALFALASGCASGPTAASCGPPRSFSSAGARPRWAAWRR
jgi:hypothetical protein